MVSHRLLTISVCLAATATAASAQEPLSLSDATARALSSHHTIRIAREAAAGAEARIGTAQGEYDPQLRLDLTAGHRRDPQTSLFSGAPAGKTAPWQNAFGSTVSVSQ